MDDIHDRGSAEALDAIRKGGDQLVVLARDRVWRALDALSEGRFVRSASFLADALASVQSLATAEQYLGIADGSKLMLAADVEVGMTLTNVGEVTDVTIEPCVSERCGRHVGLKVGEHELQFRGDQEVFVVAE